jgi:hypothetical protein
MTICAENCLPCVATNSITFHKSIGWGILLFSIIHTLAHMRNFYRFAKVTKTGVIGFLKMNFATVPVSNKKKDLSFYLSLANIDVSFFL